MGHAGGGGHFVYSIVGDCANTASRIEGLNKKLGTQILAASGVVEEGLSIDLSSVPEFTGIDEFYVRLRPWAGSTKRMEKHRVHPYESGIIEKIEVKRSSFVKRAKLYYLQ